MKKASVLRVVCLMAAVAICAAVLTGCAALPCVETAHGGTDADVAVIVNGEEIRRSDIDARLAAAELSYANGVVQIDEMELPEQEKAAMLAKLKDAKKSREEVLDELIRQTVMLQEAERRGVTAADDEVNAYVEQQYAAFQEAASQNEQGRAAAEYIATYRKDNGLSEEAYLEKVAEVTRRALVCDKLSEALQAEGQDPENYVDDLVAQATILYPAT